MYPAVPSRSERVAAACARLLLLATALLALSGQAALILGASLPAWQHAAILLDSLGVGLFAVIRALFIPRTVTRHSGI